MDTIDLKIFACSGSTAMKLFIVYSWATGRGRTCVHFPFTTQIVAFEWGTFNYSILPSVPYITQHLLGRKAKEWGRTARCLYKEKDAECKVRHHCWGSYAIKKNIVQYCCSESDPDNLYLWRTYPNSECSQQVCMHLKRTEQGRLKKERERKYNMKQGMSQRKRRSASRCLWHFLNPWLNCDTIWCLT